ncbi:hypothetical protein AB0M05_35215 [Streptomyces violaceusniger]|uniref:hypothetical protein n=1 Tax=Streptomyces violaceusniger TaxID=68280 RepID=UPI003434901D
MHTFSPDSILAARFHNAQAGLELIDIVDAALPVTRVTAEVLAQDSKGLPLTEEFVLRLVDHQMTSPRGIAGVLGLPKAMVDQTIAQLFGSDDLRWARLAAGSTEDQPNLRLTDKGRNTALTAASVAPVRTSQSVLFDQMRWKAAPYDGRTTIPRGQAVDDGMIMLPAARSGPVDDGDITAAELTALLRENGRTDREILQVRSIIQTPARRVLPVKLLVYADPQRTDIELGMVIDGERSQPHELELLGHGGAKALGITVAPPPERPLLDPDLEKKRVPLQEVTQQRTAEAAVQLGSPRPVPGPPEASQTPRDDEIRAIGVFEHPEVLGEALTSARRRLLIIAPWIKNAIITTDFLRKLEGRLTKNVTIDIAYGYEEDDTKTDPAAVRKLTNLADRYKDKFTFTRLKSTHAKILVYDDVWVTTSFNWLSFKGDPDRTYRMEEGSLVRNRQNADTQYARYLQMIKEQRRS